MAKKSVLDLCEMKRAGNQIAWLTGYDSPTATFEEAAGVDLILVGDSLGMCVFGYPGTVLPHGGGRACPVHGVDRAGALRTGADVSWAGRRRKRGEGNA